MTAYYSFNLLLIVRARRKSQIHGIHGNP